MYCMCVYINEQKQGTSAGGLRELLCLIKNKRNTYHLEVCGGIDNLNEV